MARIVLKIKEHLPNYRFGYSLKEDISNITWQESNILEINNSGNFTVYVKDISGNIKARKNIYIMCLDDESICNINTYPIFAINSCNISVLPIVKTSSVSEVCSINIYPSINISICTITTYINKI